jgi:hypothetical protein
MHSLRNVSLIPMVLSNQIGVVLCIIYGTLLWACVYLGCMYHSWLLLITSYILMKKDQSCWTYPFWIFFRGVNLPITFQLRVSIDSCCVDEISAIKAWYVPDEMSLTQPTNLSISLYMTISFVSVLFDNILVLNNGTDKSCRCHTNPNDAQPFVWVYKHIRVLGTSLEVSQFLVV